MLRQQTKYHNRFSSQQQRYYSEPPKTGNASKVKFWPFLALIGVTSLGYVGLVNRRKDMPAVAAPQTAGQLPAPAKSTPTFSPSDVTVLFVLALSSTTASPTSPPAISFAPSKTAPAPNSAT